MAVVRIEGVEFEFEDAHEFAERALIYGDANRKPLSPGISLAASIEMTVRSGGGFDVTLAELEKAEASAVLAEWLQSHDAPEAGRTLYGVLAS